MLGDAQAVITAFASSGHWLGIPTGRVAAASQVPLGGYVRLPLMRVWAPHLADGLMGNQ